MSVSTTLANILKLIDKDVAVIAQIGDDVQFDSQTALTLSRYATTLSAIKDIQDKDQAKEKKELNKLSTEELIQLLKNQEQK